jgi:ribosomal protein S18 acetylase RimI-like enzyme
MSTAIALRPITIHERDELRAFADRYWVELMPHAPVIRDLARRDAFLDSELRFDDPGTLLWWGTLSGIPVGFARVELRQSHDGLTATIRDLYIDVPWRRRGYGIHLADRIVEEMRVRGVHRIDLTARADNPGAQAFWRAAGFAVAAWQFRLYLDERE